MTLTVDVPVSQPSHKQEQQRLPGSMGSWGTVQVSVRFNQFFWIEDLLVIIEKAVERELLEIHQKKSNFLSVELLSKSVAGDLEDTQEIEWFSVTAHNFGDDYSTFAAVKSC